MSAFRVEGPRLSRQGDQHVVDATIRRDGRDDHIWFRSTAPLAAEAVDSFATLALLPAMRRGVPLEVAAPVSSRLLRGFDRVQELFSGWRPLDFQRVPVQAAERAEAFPRRTTRAYSFFSCGVDSFYTLMRHRAEIAATVFVLGFDVSLEDEALAASVSDAVRQATSEIGVPVVTVETNLRAFLDQHCDWNDAHGAALAAVGQLVAPAGYQVLVPGSKPFHEFHLMGCHFAIDPWWSTERVEIDHDGCERSRVGKIAAIAEYPPAMRWLRVCWKNPGGAYNCGRCGKCLRTMAYLEAVGALSRCRTFPVPLSLNALRASRTRERNFHQIHEAIAALRAHGGNRPLEAALRATMVRPPGPFASALRRFGRTPVGGWARSALRALAVRGWPIATAAGSWTGTSP